MDYKLNGQFTTIEEATAIAAMITFHNGIAPVDNVNEYHNLTSGIYLSGPWTDIGNQPEHPAGSTRPFLFRFNKTNDLQPQGFNVGLVRDTAIRHAVEGEPPNWGYALADLNREVTEQLEVLKNS